MPYKKYFIAIIIPPPLFSKIETIKQNLFLEYHLKGSLRSPAHITLHRPFEWKEEKEHILIEKLKEFKFDNPFKIEFNNFNFFEPRVIFIDVIKNEHLFDLHKKLTHFAKRELKLLNEAEDKRGFHPHVTVAFRDLKKPLFYELKSIFQIQNFSGEFLCSQIALLKLNKTWETIHYF